MIREHRVLQETIFHCEITQIVRTHPINPGAQLRQVKAFTEAILPVRAQQKKTALKLSLSLLSARKLKSYGLDLVK